MSGVDHRPYLVEGDLRTPEDVLAWLCEYDPREQLGDALVELRVQLRRERRQACRRGALDKWRRISELVRWARDGRDRFKQITGQSWGNLRMFLAFRAAARQP